MLDIRRLENGLERLGAGSRPTTPPSASPVAIDAFSGPRPGRKTLVQLGSEAKEAALFLPVVRQVFAQAQQPGRRERDGMPLCKKSANDARSEIGQPDERSQAKLVHSQA